mmetsp:Transcript_11011/g.21817  ORF Transcript_11011/g.21817 Transcript_11011/m.21817 type:complete len:469 (+) Transcript_11011:192-1598(+)
MNDRPNEMNLCRKYGTLSQHSLFTTEIWKNWGSQGVPSKHPPSYVKEQTARILDLLRDRLEERDTLPPVNEAVVVGKGHIHHRPGHDLAIHHHRPHFCGVHPEKRALRHVDDGAPHEAPEHTPVADGKRPPGHVFERKRALSGLRSVHGDGPLHLRETHRLRVPQHRHDEARGRGHSDRDVAVVPIDNLLGVPVNDGIDRGHLPERSSGGGDERAHEPELDAVLLDKGILVARPEFHEVAHVHLLEGGEHGGGVLCFLQTCGHALAHPGHLHAALGPGTGGGQHSSGGDGRGGSGSRRLDLRRGGGGDRRLGHRWGGLLLERSLRLRSGGRRRRPHRVRVDLEQRLTHRHRLVHLTQYFRHGPSFRRAHIDADLVGLQHDDHLVRAHGCAGWGRDLNDGALRNTIAHGGNLHGHHRHGSDRGGTEGRRREGAEGHRRREGAGMKRRRSRTGGADARDKGLDIGDATAQ